MTKAEKDTRGVLTLRINYRETLRNIRIIKEFIIDLEKIIKDYNLVDNLTGDMLQVDLNYIDIAQKSQFAIKFLGDLRDNLDVYALAKSKIDKETKRKREDVEIKKLSLSNIIIICLLIMILILLIGISIGIGYMAIANLESVVYKGI